MGQFAQRTNGYVGGIISDASAQMGITGVSPIISQDLLSGIGMSNQQADLFSSFMGGDMQRMSWEGWKSGNPAFRLWDQAGRSVFQTNGAASLETMAYWAARQNQFPAGAGNFLNGFPVKGTPTEQGSWLFGFDAGNLSGVQSDILSAYQTGGTQGINLYQMQKSAEAQAASAGVQMAGHRLAGELPVGRKERRHLGQSHQRFELGHRGPAGRSQPIVAAGGLRRAKTANGHAEPVRHPKREHPAAADEHHQRL